MKAFSAVNRSFGISFLAFIFCVINNSSIYGQEQNAQVNPILKTITLDEAVISANKTLEPIKKVAQAIKIINSRKIEEIAPPTTAELLTSGAGLSVQKSQQGGGSPNLRGFEANRILLVVDGVRMNNLIYRAGHLQNIITIDPAILDKVEILFGPSSTIYGSDALGGTIHLITKDPILADKEGRNIYKVNAYSRFASANNGITAHADFNYGTQKFGSFTSITSNTFGDLRMGANKNPFYDTLWSERPYYMQRFGTVDSMVKNNDPLIQKYSGYDQIDVMQKFLYKPNDKFSHRLNLQFSNSSNIPRYDRLTDANSHGLSYAQWYYGPQLRFFSAYDLIAKNILGFDQLHFGLSEQYIEESRNSRKTGGDFLTHRHEFVNVNGGDLDLFKSWNKHELHMGAEFQLNTLTSAACNENVLNGNNTIVTSRYPDGENTMNFIDVYVSHRWDIQEKLSFSQSFRTGYTVLHSSFVNEALFPYPFKEMTQKNSTWSGALGLIYLPTSSWKLAVNLSTAYRVPNIDDLTKIFERTPGTIIVPNPDIKPERTYNAEFGITKSWDSGLRWETNVFTTSFNNIIVIAPFTYLGHDSIVFDGDYCKVLSGQNKDEAFLYGFSSSINGKICKAFSVEAGIYYTYGRIKEDDGEKPMTSIAPLTGKIGSSFTHKSLNTSFFILFNGWKLAKDYYVGGEDNEQYATPKGMPAWFTLNFRIDYKLNKYLGLQLGIDNILDTQYRMFASGINAPGRNILATLRFSL